MSLSEQECMELLPWFLNNTLDDTEKQAVSAQLAVSPALQEALEELRLLQKNLPPESDFPASEMGWKRLQKQLQQPPVDLMEQAHIDKHEVPSSGNPWIKPVAIAATFIVALQIGLFSLNSSEENQQMQLLSGSPVYLDDTQIILQLTLAPDAQWQAISELLRMLNANLIMGPSAIGLVHISLSLAQTKLDGQSPQSAEQVVEWLQSNSLIEHAALEPR